MRLSLSAVASWEGSATGPDISAACTPAFAAQLIGAVPAACQSLVLGEFLVHQAVQAPNSFSLQGLTQLRTLRISCISPVQEAVLAALRASAPSLTSLTSLQAWSSGDTS